MYDMRVTQPHEPMIVARVADQLYTCFICMKCKYSSVYLGVPKYTDITSLFILVHTARPLLISGLADLLALIAVAVIDVDLLVVDVLHMAQSILEPHSQR